MSEQTYEKQVHDLMDEALRTHDATRLHEIADELKGISAWRSEVIVRRWARDEERKQAEKVSNG